MDSITVNHQITFRQICDNLIAAFESGHYGAMYWVRDFKYIGKQKLSKGNIWYDQPEIFRQAGPVFRLIYDDPKKPEGNGKGKMDIDIKKIKCGLTKLAAHYDAFFDIARDKATAADADLMLQCIVFGEEVYA